jgi:hypothetical protein
MVLQSVDINSIIADRAVMAALDPRRFAAQEWRPKWSIVRETLGIELLLNQVSDARAHG